MSPVQFRGYGVHGSDFTLIAERVTHWHAVDYNGRVGTRMYLDTGKEVTTEEWPHDVERKLKEATCQAR